MHDATSCSREDSLNERVGPCDTLSCFFFSALWLQRSQSILVQENSQRRISISLVSRRSRSRPPHAYKWDPCPWIGLWIRLQDSINPDLPSRLKIPLLTKNEALFQLPHTPVGGRMLFNHLKHYRVLQVEMHVAIFPFRRHAMCYLEHQGSRWIGFFPSRRRENSNSNISRVSLTPTTFHVTRRCMERTSISRLFR